MNTAQRTYRERDRRRRQGVRVRVRVRHTVPAGSFLRVTAQDQKNLIVLMLLVGLLCIGFIIAGAYAANLNYTNNQLRESNTALQGEVESLQIEIKSSSNIANIEKTARTRLGMVYPDGDALVVLSEADKPGSNFAANLRRSALEQPR
ncbi:MAG: cell division protein FtsL [Anaerovoracaceae bacterium]|jgi:cell division protein FtsL